MSEITWGTSQQNRLTLILDGHEFQKKLETKTTTHWKCSKWSSYKCKVTAITTGKQLLSKKNEHNHEIVPGHVQAKQIIGQMKETARTEQNPVNNMIIASSLLPIGSDIATQLSLPTRSPHALPCTPNTTHSWYRQVFLTSSQFFSFQSFY